MNFRPEHYLEAAREKVASAFNLYTDSSYVDSLYLAGVAVECLLRAYHLRKTDKFDDRHDLIDLMKQSSIADFIPIEMNREFGASLTAVWRRWKNNYRYACESRLSSELRNMGLYVGIKGNPLKENVRITLSAAKKLINAGVLSWNSNRKY
jgi:HEPN domain-containing protein